MSTATAAVEVPCGRGAAFDIFTGRVTLEHGGWDRVPAADPGMTGGYSHGWQELLGFYAQAAEED